MMLFQSTFLGMGLTLTLAYCTSAHSPRSLSFPHYFSALSPPITFNMIYRNNRPHVLGGDLAEWLWR